MEKEDKNGLVLDRSGFIFSDKPIPVSRELAASIGRIMDGTGLTYKNVEEFKEEE